jgi:hypothetical protein
MTRAAGERGRLLSGLAAALLGTAFALAPAPAAAGADDPPGAAPAPDAVDWDAVGRIGVVEVVTRDPDGAERVTKCWIVALDGFGFVRTGSTRWGRNLTREAALELRADGAVHRLRALAEVDYDRRTRVNQAFRAKYGWQDRLVHPFGATDARIFRLEPPLVPPAAP